MQLGFDFSAVNSATPIKASLVSKITKLLALAESDNENEAALAAKMAHKLMRKHALSMADLSKEDAAKTDPVTDCFMEVGQTAWRIQLAWVLAKHCNITMLRSKRYIGTHPKTKEPLKGGYKSRVFAWAFGHQSDLEIWRYLYDVAERQIQTKAKAHRASYHPHKTSRADMNEFRLGAAYGLGEKLVAQRKAAKAEDTSGCTAIALRSRADAAKALCKEKCPQTGSYSSSVGVSSAGMAAGRSIQLSKGLRGSSGSAPKKLRG